MDNQYLIGKKPDKKTDFLQGVRDGIPIALGYLAVSFSLGILVREGGLSVFEGALLSLTNVTSAGEFAGLRIILAGGTLLEIVLTEFIINLRYALMSLSLSQKLSEDVTPRQRLVIAFANTDEIFAVAMAHRKGLTFPYMVGLESFPVFGWTLGTVLGSIAADLMPETIANAMSVALYGMFIAIVLPVAKKSKPVLLVAAIAVVISFCIYYNPKLSFISEGIGIILATVVAAGVGALLFPVDTKENERE